MVDKKREVYIPNPPLKQRMLVIMEITNCTFSHFVEGVEWVSVFFFTVWSINKLLQLVTKFYCASCTSNEEPFSYNIKSVWAWLPLYLTCKEKTRTLKSVIVDPRRTVDEWQTYFLSDLEMLLYSWCMILFGCFLVKCWKEFGNKTRQIQVFLFHAFGGTYFSILTIL